MPLETSLTEEELKRLEDDYEEFIKLETTTPYDGWYLVFAFAGFLNKINEYFNGKFIRSLKSSGLFELNQNKKNFDLFRLKTGNVNVNTITTSVASEPAPVAPEKANSTAVEISDINSISALKKLLNLFKEFANQTSPKPTDGFYMISRFGSFLKDKNIKYTKKLKDILNESHLFELVDNKFKPVESTGDSVAPAVASNRLDKHYEDFIKLKTTKSYDGWYLVSDFGSYLSNLKHSYTGKFVKFLAKSGYFEFNKDDKGRDYFRKKRRNQTMPLSTVSPEVGIEVHTPPVEAPVPVSPISMSAKSALVPSSSSSRDTIMAVHQPITHINGIPINKIEALVYLFEEYTSTLETQPDNGFYKLNDFADFLELSGFECGEDAESFISKTNMFIAIKTPVGIKLKIIATPPPYGLFMSLFYKFQERVQRPGKIYTISEFDAFLHDENLAYPEPSAQIFRRTGIFEVYTDDSGVTYFSAKSALSLLEGKTSIQIADSNPLGEQPQILVSYHDEMTDGSEKSAASFSSLTAKLVGLYYRFIGKKKA